MSNDDPQGPAAPRPVVLDETALSRLRELDPDGRHGVLRRVLGAFETSLSRMLAQLAAERDNGNPAVVGSVAHTLKSSSASVGALELAQVCAEVEHRLRENLPGDLAVDLARLTAAGQAALAAVETMLRA